MRNLEPNNNPLLAETGLPAFSAFQAKHVLPAIEVLIAQNQAQLENLLSQRSYTFENLILPLEAMEERLHQVWNLISHMEAVKNNSTWHEAYEKALAKITEYNENLNQNEQLYQAYLAISKTKQHSAIDNALREFRLSGIHLKPQDRDVLKQLYIRISELQSQFEHQVLKATDAWYLHINPEQAATLQGLPAHTVKTAKQDAEEKGLSGWVLGLDAPCYHAVMTYAQHRDLRKQLYEAQVTRASELEGGHWDNGPLMVEILKLRQQAATLLGFNNYADYALEKRIAKTSEEVLNFLENVKQHAKAKALQELEILKTFVLAQDKITELQPWDFAYYSEKLRQQKFNISEEQFRQYFPVNLVLQGFFSIVQDIFGVSVIEVKDFDRWHETVRLFEVYDTHGKITGKFYLDLFARPHKQAGGWVSDYKRRLQQGETLQIPITFLTTNFTLSGDPLMTGLRHDEVNTLLHEFGHCLHHVLTQVDLPSLSGTSGVELDGVEFPSQFMENYCWETESLKRLTKHLKTQQPLDEALIVKLREAKNFHIGFYLLRQLELALFDFILHREKDISTVSDIQNLLDNIREQTALIPVPAFNRFQNTFTHIFGGAYAAGYYSYAWAEVMACDAFAVFKEKGIFDKTTGQQFLSAILSQGGSAPALNLFVNFRGRKPQNQAFLEYYNLN